MILRFKVLWEWKTEGRTNEEKDWRAEKENTGDISRAVKTRDNRGTIVVVCHFVEKTAIKDKLLAWDIHFVTGYIYVSRNM